MGIMDNLQGATAQQKKAALDALAAGGQRALDAYTSSLGNVNSAQQTAMDRVTGHASYLGDAAGKELQGIVAGPGDAARVALQRQIGAQQMDNQARQASTGAYFDQIAAAIPLAKQYGDNEIGIAKTNFENQAARERQQQAWAEEQHRMQMETMALQQEMQRMSLAAAQAKQNEYKDPFTDAQKAKLGQALSDDERVAQMQAELDARVNAENQRVAAAWKAMQETPNEMRPEDRAGYTADRAERENDGIVAARQQFGYVPMSTLSTSSDRDVQDESKRQSVGATRMAMSPLASLINQAVNVTKASTPEQPAAPVVDWRANAQSAYNQGDALIKALQAQFEPYQKVQAARTAYTDMFGNDPVAQAKAILSNPYPDQETVDKQSLNNAILQQQMENYAQTGYKTPQEMLQALQTQQGLDTFGQNPNDAKLAASMPNDPDTGEALTAQDVAQVRQSGEYAEAISTAQEMLGASMQDNGTPVTANQVQQAVLRAAQNWSDPSMVSYVLPVLLHDLKASGMLVSDAYAANPTGA